MKSKWLERGFFHLPCFKLILSEKEWNRITGLKDVEWITTRSDATTHVFKDREGHRILICIRPHKETGTSFSAWLGLLVHEVSHFIDETRLPPGVEKTDEVKAYATQSCFLQLVWDYERQMDGQINFSKKRKVNKKQEKKK